MLTLNLYSVVAVTGLAGHAFGSWRSRETHLMWLKDFLPKHIKNIRIMTYGYNSSLVEDTKSTLRLADYRSNFIQQLENARSSAEVYNNCLFHPIFLTPADAVNCLPGPADYIPRSQPGWDFDTTGNPSRATKIGLGSHNNW